MRPILRASPAAIRRAMAMFAPLDRPAALPLGKRKQSDRQSDLAAAQPVERGAVHVHKNVDSKATS